MKNEGCLEDEIGLFLRLFVAETARVWAELFMDMFNELFE
jgi:hypothetical protein